MNIVCVLIKGIWIWLGRRGIKKWLTFFLVFSYIDVLVKWPILEKAFDICDKEAWGEQV